MVEVQRRLPVIPRERNGGVCTAPGEIRPWEVKHITSISIDGVIGVIGAIASIVSLALTIYDRRKDQKKK